MLAPVVIPTPWPCLPHEQKLVSGPLDDPSPIRRQPPVPQVPSYISAITSDVRAQVKLRLPSPCVVATACCCGHNPCQHLAVTYHVVSPLLSDFSPSCLFASPFSPHPLSPCTSDFTSASHPAASSLLPRLLNPPHSHPLLRFSPAYHASLRRSWGGCVLKWLSLQAAKRRLQHLVPALPAATHQSR